MRIRFTFLLLLTSFFVHAQNLNRELSREEALEDIQLLKKTLEESHPGMYRFTSKEEMDEAYSQAMAEITNTNLFDFYGEALELLSLIRCGHTQAELPEEISNTYQKELLRLPFDVEFLDRRMLVSEDYSPSNDIERGSEILSIDGVKTDKILTSLFQKINNDGFVESFRYEWLERFFWEYYPQFFTESGLPESYKIEYRRPFAEETQKLTLSGVSNDYVREKKGKNNEERFSLQLEDDYALLTVKSFSGRSKDFYGFLEESFKSINNSGVQNLILDLRGNGGGTDEYGAKLVSYLAKSDFKYFDRIEVTENYASQNKRVKSENGRYYRTGHVGLKGWSPAKNKFEGQVYVLINGISFSTTADVASILNDNGWAIFIGQESGGGAYGNTSGHSKYLVLPNSEIVVNVPMWMYFTSLKKEYPIGRGVIPEYTTSPSLQAFIDRIDVEMEKAVSLIQSSSR